MNNHSIPSMYAVRNSPYLSDTLASRGLEEPAHATRGLEEPFFPVVLLCQFLVTAGNRWKKKVLVVCLAGCAVVSVFGSGGK